VRRRFDDHQRNAVDRRVVGVEKHALLTTVLHTPDLAAHREDGEAGRDAARHILVELTGSFLEHGGELAQLLLSEHGESLLRISGRLH
jgi:hypothetical protein